MCTILQSKFRAASDPRIAIPEMEARMNLWDYVCHWRLLIVCVYVHISVRLNVAIYIQSVSDPREEFQEMEPRKNLWDYVCHLRR